MFATLSITRGRTIDVWIFVHLAPNPTGLGQPTTLMAFVSQNTPTASSGVGEKWEDITITIVKPNGDPETLGPYTADPVGFVATFYTPDQLGTYTFQSHFPGQTLSTGVLVGPAAAAATGPIEPEPTEGFALTTTKLVVITVAIIAVAGIVAFWAIKKRK